MFYKPKTLVAFTLCLVMFMCCTKKEQKEKAGYIGPSKITVEDGKMTPEVLLSFGRLSDPQLSPDGTKILYGVSYTSVDENRSCRNLFICDVDGKNKHQLTYEGTSINNARWAEDGKKIYYIQNGQIWAAKLKTKKSGEYKLKDKVQVTDIPNGVSEFKLSVGSKMLMFVSTVPGNVKTPKDTDPKLDKAKAYVADDLMYRHWDHWVTELPHTYIAPWPKEILEDNNTLQNKIGINEATDILGGADVKFELPLEPFGGLEQLSFSPDGSKIAYSCKKLEGKQYAFSTNSEIYIYNILTGNTQLIPMGGGYDTNPIWSPDGTKLAWLSMKRDGYEADKIRLMVCNYSNNQVSNITDLSYNFKYNVGDILWAKDSKSIYFSALTEGLEALYKANIIDTPQQVNISSTKNGLTSIIEGETSTIQRLTSDSLWFDFKAPFAVLPNNTILATYCSMDFPNELVAVKSANDIEQITHENDAILNQLAPHKTEARIIKTVDGKDMLSWVLYPPQFDSTKVYPAIEICLGGPQGTLSQSWSYRWNYRLMASQGYIVILPNRRGTTAFGQEWTEQISGDYIGLNMQDYLSAAKAIKAEPYVGKLAACGASYGGFSVYYLAGIHGNVYDCFIAHAGIFDESYMYYETEELWFPNWDNGGLTEYNYTEGQMGSKGDGITYGGMQQAGSPWSSQQKALRHYANSPVKNVDKWHTPILCIHGCKDFRIPYDQGMAAFNCAQMMGVPSKLIIFPTENHWILEPQNALFWHRNYFEWLDKWCKN